MSLRRAEGSVVLVALWALAFFGMLTVTLAARVQSQVSFIRRFQDARTLEWTAASGVSYALGVLRKQAANKETPLEGGLAEAFGGFKENSFEGPRAGRFQIGRAEINPETGAEEFVFGFQDEESKINVNKVPEEVLARFYQYAGGLSEEEAGSLARASVEWRARAVEFSEFGHALGDEGAGFGCVEELLLVPGMSAPVWQRLKDHATVFGEKGKLNMNTASQETLTALGVNEGLAARIVQYRSAQLAVLKPEDPSNAKIFNDLGDLTQKVGVSAGEIDELQNIASVWGFESQTVRFFSRASYGTRSVRLECVADREKARLLFFRVLRY